MSQAPEMTSVVSKDFLSDTQTLKYTVYDPI
jgi:hypothetical protein